MVARLAGDFYPMDAELSLRPRMRRLFWHLTAMWAVVCLAKAVAMFWALNSLSLDTFVLVKSISMPAANLLAVVLTVVRRRPRGPQGGADRRRRRIRSRSLPDPRHRGTVQACPTRPTGC